MEAAVITTYRCISRCQMCHTWKFPTREEEEFRPSLLEKLPRLSFCNVTGGEPFLRSDIGEIVRLLKRKSKRLVVSTNGSLTDEILALAASNRDIGIRVSLEGLAETNDRLRGSAGGFDRGLKTLLGLKSLGLKDIGFGITVSDGNTKDMLELHKLAGELGVEFATAIVHNSYYFHKLDNAVARRAEVTASFEELIRDQLASPKIKNWYRAYFNQGLIGHMQGRPRPLPCGAGTDLFFLDPWGEVRPCNGLEKAGWPESMGNLHEKPFLEIWRSKRANGVRSRVKECARGCWMIGTAGPAMKKRIWRPTLWVLRRKWLGRTGLEQ